jgi:hypothetical protein
MPRAIENIRVVSGEVTPAAAGPGGEDAIVFEGDEGIGAVKTCADQPDGVDDSGGGAAHWLQLPRVLWPMALDNTLMAARVAGGEAVPDSTHGRTGAE